MKRLLAAAFVAALRSTRRRMTPQAGLLQKHVVIISSVGEDVVLKIGTNTWRMNYATAMFLSSAIRSVAQTVKRANGDTGRYTNMSGVLHDAEKGPDAGQPFTPGGLYDVNKSYLRKDQVGARGQGQLVIMKLGGIEADLPYPTAFTIAQWVRLRAKESKRRAGDVRHWSEINEWQYGPGV